MRFNYRLRFAFSLCLELGIDDPVHWYRQCPPKVLDAWIAYRIVENEEENKPDDGDPAEVFASRFGHLANAME